MSCDPQFRQLAGCGLWVPASAPEPVAAPPPPTAPRDEDVAELVEDVIVDLRTVRQVLGLGRLLCGALTVMALCAIWPVASFDALGIWSVHEPPRPAFAPRAPADASQADSRALAGFLSERRRAHDLVRLALVLVPADLEVSAFEMSATPGGPGQGAALAVGVDAACEQPGPAIAYAASLDALGGAATATSAPSTAIETAPATTYHIAAQMPAERLPESAR